MVSSSTRQFIRQQAQFRCEYCHSPEYLSPDRFTLDHIQPRSRQGTDEIQNLALACHRCNERRSNVTHGLDPKTQTIVPIFNPRQDNWFEHFAWTQDGLRITSHTPIGRVTCDRFNNLTKILNHRP